MLSLLIVPLMHFELIAIPGSVSSSRIVWRRAFGEADALLDAEQLGFIGIAVMFNP